MIEINLLPWREQLRQQRKCQFIFAVSISLLMAILFIIQCHHMLIAKLAKQQTSNSYLQQVISEYKKDLRAVKKLQLERNQYLARLELISNLQSHRTETIDIFNALAVNLPDCLYLHTVKREDGKVTISGKAQTDTCIARLMRNFNNTTRFTEPHLKEIKTDNSNLTYNKDFQLQFNQK